MRYARWPACKATWSEPTRAAPSRPLRDDETAAGEKRKSAIVEADANNMTVRLRSFRPAAVLALFGLVAAFFLAAAGSASASAPYRFRAVSGYTESPTSEAWVLSAINKARAARHLRPLTVDPRLRHSANLHNVAMARANKMSHQLSGERFFADRISAAGVHWTAAEENIGWNGLMSPTGALQLHKMMMAEGRPPAGQSNHYSNIVSPSVNRIGIDVIYDRAHHKIWLTEDFARE